MPINTGINANQIVNLVDVCVDQETPRDNPDCCPALIIAPMLDTGTADPNTSISVTSYESATTLFGEGSIAADMARFYFLNCGLGELYVSGLPNAGTPASAIIEINSTATENGTFNVQIFDAFYSVPVIIDDTAAEILSDLADQVNADSDALYTAIYNSNQITFVMKNGGSFANGASIVTSNTFSDKIAEGLIEAQNTGFRNGVEFYDIETALDELGCCCYDFIMVPFNDEPTWNILQTELDVRWDCSKLIGGHWYAPKQDTYDNLVTIQPAYTHGSIISVCNDVQYAPWQKVAAWVGRGHCSTCQDPTQRWAGPLIGIRCQNLKCNEACFSDAERGLLARNGISVSKCGTTGTEEIQLTVTAADFALDQVGFFPQNYYTTMRFVRELKDFIESQYTNVKIVENLENELDGSDAVTIPIIVAELAQWSRITQSGIIDNSTSLSDFIQVEINQDNPYRIDMCITIDLINALRSFAIKVQPRLTLSTNIN